MKFRAMTRKCAAVLAAVWILAVPAQAESFSAIVTSKSMSVYADESCTWELGKLGMTTVVTVESYSGGTAKITLNGNTGYARVSDMAALSSLAKPATISANTRVYQKPSTKSKSLQVKKGMQVNLLATSGQWAMVENAGAVAYMNKAQLTLNGESPAPTAAPQDKVVWETFLAVVTGGRARVYQSYSEESVCLGSVAEGVTVTVLGYNSTWAYIELNGRRGFAKVASLTRTGGGQVDPAPTATPAPTKAPEKDYINNTSYTVEQRIYLFLTREMGLNTAVACGILANVERECSFNVQDASYDGGYGIVQWTGSRNTALKNWCKNNGYDYTTLEGQLWYLKHDLEDNYPKILKYLKGVSNTAAGAYDAAYYFCYNFEIPANRASRSVERGNIAKDKYWRKYAA